MKYIVITFTGRTPKHFIGTMSMDGKSARTVLEVNTEHTANVVCAKLNKLEGADAAEVAQALIAAE